MLLENERGVGLPTLLRKIKRNIILKQPGMELIGSDAGRAGGVQTVQTAKEPEEVLAEVNKTS